MSETPPEPIGAEALAAFRAAELRMVAELVDLSGRPEWAAEIRDNALMLDPAQGRA